MPDESSPGEREPHQEPSDESAPNTIASRLVNRIDGRRFETWYQERQIAENIRKGRPYFNGPSRVPSPERHSPSGLLQCHRKLVYRQENAPKEEADPEGIFWVGSRIEEDLIVPFLEDVISSEEYIRNSMWVDFVVETDTGEIHIKGATDPVIVNQESNPLLLTEVKTKQSVDHVTKPNPHHLAQIHCYLYGLSQSYDRITNAVVIYVSRDSLEMKALPVEFDPWFWRESVVEWAATHTEYRLDGRLPPRTPEQGWECEFCSFRERCGKGDEDVADEAPEGLLPLFDYPREQLVEYLEAHADRNARLIPSLAHQYPDLAEEYGVYDWQCQNCDAAFSWRVVEWSGVLSNPPSCLNCSSQNALRGPQPSQQGP